MQLPRKYRAVLATVLLMLTAVPVLAAEAGPMGHWEGEIQIPGTRLGADIDPSQDGGARVCCGTISSGTTTTPSPGRTWSSASRMACTL